MSANEVVESIVAVAVIALLVAMCVGIRSLEQDVTAPADASVETSAAALE